MSWRRISNSATRRLTIDNDWVQFSARFSGTSQEVAVPMSAVSGIFAKETGYGFAFTIPQDPAAVLTSTLKQDQDIDAALARIDAGKYGVCEECSGRIAPERLEAVPYATMCVKCADRVQREALR